MQFAVTALIAALAGKAIAAPATGPAIMTVYYFAFNCVEHGDTCSYDFKLYNSAPGNPGGLVPGGVKCQKTVPFTGTTETGNGQLPAVTDGTCENSPHTWTVTTNADGTFTLAATLSGAGSDTASHIITQDDILRLDLTASSVPFYRGQPNFILNKQN